MITKNASNVLRKIAHVSGEYCSMYAQYLNKKIEKKANTDIQQLTDIVTQYAPKDWSYMGVNSYADKKGSRTMDAFVAVGDDEYSIGFDKGDTKKVHKIIDKILKNDNTGADSIEFEIDSDGEYNYYPIHSNQQQRSHIQDIINSINTGELNKQLKDAKTKGLRPASELYDVEKDILKGMKPAVRKQIKSVDYELGDGDFSVTLVDGNTGIYNIDDDIIF